MDDNNYGYWEFFSSTGNIDFYLKLKEKEHTNISNVDMPHEGDSISLQ